MFRNRCLEAVLLNYMPCDILYTGGFAMEAKTEAADSIAVMENLHDYKPTVGKLIFVIFIKRQSNCSLDRRIRKFTKLL